MSKPCDQERMTSAHLLISGRVQGVGFRKFSQAAAHMLHLFGAVRNLSDGRVELQVEGTREKIEALIARLWEGPSRSRVDHIDVSWKTETIGHTTFLISV